MNKRRPYLDFNTIYLSQHLLELQKLSNDYLKEKEVKNKKYMVNNQIMDFNSTISLLKESSELPVLNENNTPLSEETKAIFEKYKNL